MDKINAPWRVDNIDGIAVVDRDGALVCGEVDYPYLIAEERARLIAAAPALLAAVELCQQQLKMLLPELHPLRAVLVEAIIAASQIIVDTAQGEAT